MDVTTPTRLLDNYVGGEGTRATAGEPLARVAPVAFFPFSGWKDSFLGDLHAHGSPAARGAAPASPRADAP